MQRPDRPLAVATTAFVSALVPLVACSDPPPPAASAPFGGSAGAAQAGGGGTAGSGAPACARCGDGSCDAGEDCTRCTRDCGACPPWVHTFAPAVEHHVAADGIGSGTAGDPMSLAAAIAQAEPGDLYWLHAGNYDVGAVELARDGTWRAPIVFRAVPGERVSIIGHIGITGAHNWVWGVELSDPTGKHLSAPFGGLELAAEGAHAINNIIHELGHNGISAWNNGSGQVIYGNLVYRSASGQPVTHPHNVYTQNDYDEHGYKYFVANAFLDADGGCAVGGCFNFHAYTEGGHVSGMHLSDNIVAQGTLLIGGYNVPHHHEVVANNHLYQATLQLGYRRPIQAEVTGNYLGRSRLSSEWFWGDGEVQYDQPLPSVYRGNQIMLPADGRHVAFRTSAYWSDDRHEGLPSIRPRDSWDDNDYSAPFEADFHAAATQLAALDLSGWRSATAAAGNAFDGNAHEVPPPASARVAVVRNAYELGRGFIAIYNWGLEPAVSVDVSDVVATGAAFSIHAANAPFDAALVDGTYDGPVNVPTHGAEFVTLIVTSSPAPPCE